MRELVEEIKAQARALALRCAPGLSDHVHIVTVEDPDQPGHFTLIVEEHADGVSELLLVDVSADHVVEHANRLDPEGAVVEGVRLAAHLVYVGRHLTGPLREALARASV